LQFCSFAVLKAQTLPCNNAIERDTSLTFQDHIQCILGSVNKLPARIPSRFLLENGYDYAVIDDLQGSLNPTNQVDYKRFILTYHSLYSSYLGGLNTRDLSDETPTTFGKVSSAPIYHLPAPERLDKTMERGSPNNPSAIRIGMGLIQYQQFRQDALQLGWVNVINNQVFDTPSGLQNNPFLTKVAFFAAPRDSSSHNNSAMFFVTPATFASNIPLQTVQKIEIDFDNGQGYQNIAWQSNVSVIWNETQNTRKTIRYKLTLQNNQVFQGHSYFYINTDMANSTNRYGIMPDATINIAATPLHSGATLQIGYSDANRASRRITRPFIVFEGFDSGGAYDYSSFISTIDDARFTSNGIEANFNNHLSATNRGNYDLIFVNYNNGMDDIRRNAVLAQEIIRWVNAQKVIFGSTEQNVVMGMSMGGLVARYGLAQMVRNGENTQVRLLITHDSPHRGAHVPLGIQYMVKAFAERVMLLYLVSDFRRAIDAHNSVAAQQMLMYRVPIGSPTILPAITNNTPVANRWLDEDYRPMVSIPTPYRIIATSQGSECAERVLLPGQEIIGLDASASMGFLSNFIKSGVKVKSNVWAAQENSSKVFEFIISKEIKLFFGAVNATVPIIKFDARGSDRIYPYETVPGGTYIISQGGSVSGGDALNLLGIINFHAAFEARIQPEFCFVPTVSALDGENVNGTTAMYLYSGGVSQNVTRINSFTTQAERGIGINNRNVEHIVFTARQSNWLFNEMQNTPNNTLNCSVSCQPTNAYTATIDKNCSSATFNLNNPPINAPITWTANTGIPRSGTGSTATVSAGIGEYVFVTYEIGVCNTHRYVTPAAFIGLEPNEAQANRIASYDICPNGLDYYEYQSNYSINAPNNTNPANFYWQVIVTDPLGTLVNQYIVQSRYHTIGFVNAGEEGTRVTSTAYYNGGCGWVALGSYADVYTNNPCGNSGRMVSPNPASNELQISNNGKSGNVVLYNKYNQVVFQGSIEPLQKLQINTAKLPNDVYFLHIIETDGKIEQKQIVISK